MWPGEREIVAVWADELQARGDRLGDVIALHLRADQIGADAGRAEIVRAAEALRLDSIETLLGPGIAELPRLRLRWQLGVVRGVYLDATAHAAHPPAPLVLEVIAKLLRRPVFRFLDDLQLEATVPDAGFERALFDELCSRDVVARPRRIVLGTMPRSFRQQWPMPMQERMVKRRYVEREQYESAVARGLSWYGPWVGVLALPWARGDKGERAHKIDRLLAQPWSDAHAGPIAASVWDTSLKVRRCALEALPLLPDAVARALPSVLALDLHGARVFGDLARICVNRIAAERPQWVAGVAENFSSNEPWVPLWLAGLGANRQLARRTVTRIRSMLQRLRTTNDNRDFRISRLKHALARFGEPFAIEFGEPTEDETIAELLTKLGRHRGP